MNSWTSSYIECAHDNTIGAKKGQRLFDCFGFNSPTFDNSKGEQTKLADYEK